MTFLAAGKVALKQNHEIGFRWIAQKLRSHKMRGLTASDRFWERYNENRCSRDTYPESYITKYTLIRIQMDSPKIEVALNGGLTARDKNISPERAGPKL